VCLVTALLFVTVCFLLFFRVCDLRNRNCLLLRFWEIRNNGVVVVVVLCVRVFLFFPSSVCFSRYVVLFLTLYCNGESEI
jgi:hypothetical protein